MNADFERALRAWGARTTLGTDFQQVLSEWLTSYIGSVDDAQMQEAVGDNREHLRLLWIRAAEELVPHDALWLLDGPKRAIAVEGSSLFLLEVGEIKKDGELPPLAISRVDLWTRNPVVHVKDSILELSSGVRNRDWTFKLPKGRLRIRAEIMRGAVPPEEQVAREIAKGTGWPLPPDVDEKPAKAARKRRDA